MTLRWRHYLAVISLVLGLGLASSAVLIRLVTNETEWGMQQRAEGAATSVAEFLPLLEAASPDRRQAMLDDVLARLGDAALQVQAWPLDGAAPRMQMYLWSAPSESSLTVAPLAEEYPVGDAAFGPKNFDVSATIVVLLLTRLFSLAGFFFRASLGFFLLSPQVDNPLLFLPSLFGSKQ